MTTIQKAVIGAALATAVGTGLYEAHRASDLEEQMQALRQQPAPAAAADQSDQLRQQLDDANRQLAELRSQNDMLRRDLADLPRLRSEVERLRNSNSQSDNDPTALAAKSWLARVNQLKQRLEQMPKSRIPEFQYLTEQDWLNAAKGDLKTEEDYRKALGGLRGAAESAFISSELKPALDQFAQANNGRFPTDLSQLQPYFNPPVDDSILQRWEIAPASAVPSVGAGPMVITQAAAVDSDYDVRYAVGADGWGGMNPSGTNVPPRWNAWTNPQSLLVPAVQAYMNANNGQQPSDPSQLTPYLTTPEQQAALQSLLKPSPPK
ncbi:MAG TPA: hypothetical protein VGO67_08055 [Verrucomicrobiae bacterium]|jgi:hypothetical protein